MSWQLLLSLLLGFMSGILCRSFLFLPWIASLFPFCLGVIASGAFLLLHRKRYAILGIFCIFLALGLLRTALTSTASKDLVEKFDTQTSFVGKVISSPDIREGSQRITLKTTGGDNILVVAPLNEVVRQGETLNVEGFLVRPEPFDTDGGRVFRYDQFLAKDGIYGLIEKASVSVVAPRENILDHVLGTLSDVKVAFTEALQAALPEPQSALAVGMLLGGKQGLGKSLTEVFTVVGLVHIVVLSGYNIMIVAEAIRKSLSILPKHFATMLALLGIMVFILIAGAGAASVRAGIMACIALFARATGRTYDALRSLGVAVLLMLLVNPLSLAFDPGFQLSVLATIGLIVGAPIVEKQIQKVSLPFLKEILATTIAAQIFVLPLLLFQTGNLSMFALPANILVLPAVPLAMMLSFIAGVVALIVPVLATLAGFPAYLLLGYVVWVAETLAALPLAHASVMAFPFLIVVILYILLFIFIFHAHKVSLNP